MRVLVTGGSGFVGRNLVRQLLQAGHEVVGVVRRPGALSEAGLGGAQEAIADLTDADAVARLPLEFDAVCHLAQSHEFRRCPEGMPDIVRINVLATTTLLDLALRAGADRFVYASTGSVYEPFDGLALEDSPVSPSGCYPLSKLAGELVAQAYAHRLRVAILRPFFVFGPGQTDRFLPKVITRIRDGVAITLNGGGDGLSLTPIFCDDGAALILRAIEQGWQGRINIASPQVVPIRHIAERIGGLIGKPPRFEESRDARPTAIVADTTRLQSLAPDFVFTPLDDALTRTLSSA